MLTRYRILLVALFLIFSTSSTNAQEGSEPPQPPLNLVVSMTESTQMSLEWVDSAFDESGFRIERSEDGTTWVEIAVLGADQTAYVDSGLLCGAITYFYRVRSYRSLDNVLSDYSEVDSAATAPCSCANALVTRASVANNGTQGNRMSQLSAISADGRFVAFVSAADNLVANDTNALNDVFLFDRYLCQISRVSVGTGGTQLNGDSWEPALSADGQYIAFFSEATNLHAGTQGRSNIYIHNRLTTETTLVSIGTDGQPGNSGSSFPVLSGDGRYVVFYSAATNLVSDTSMGAGHYYLRDLQTGITSVIAASTEPPVSTGLNGGNRPGISTDGRYIQFESGVNPQTGTYDDYTYIYVRDTLTGENIPVSQSDNQEAGNHDSLLGSISGDGHYVAFTSYASNLVPDDTNNRIDIFLFDLVTRTMQRVSTTSTGEQANGDSDMVRLSGDGRFVAFSSFANNLDADDNNGHEDLFIKDMSTGMVNRAWTNYSGQQLTSNGNFTYISISADGNYLAFASESNNLVPDDTNNTADVFIYNNLAPGAPRQLSVAPVSQSQINLSWVDNSFEEEGFRVERSVGDVGNWSPVAITTANQTTYQDTGLNCNTTTYYRVKSFGVGVNSTYSNAASAKTAACNPPAAPSLLLPAANAFIANQTPLLSWIPSGGGISFDLQIDNAADFLAPEVNITSGGTSFRPLTPLPEGKYYWRVRAENDLAQKGNWSAIYAFTVDITPPNPPVLTIPTASSFHSKRPALTWDASVGANQYQLQVDINNPPLSSIVTVSSLNYVPAFDLLYDTYHWRVRALDAAGNISDWSAVNTFTILLGDGSRPVTRFFAGDTADLSWSAISWATGYQVEVDNNPAFSSPDWNSGLISKDTQAVSTPTLTDGIWYWRVHARKSDSTWANWGLTENFAIDQP